MNKTKNLSLVIVLISFAIGIYFYSRMPEMMASHWDYRGEVDGYMPKFLGLFLMPIISAVLFGFFLLIPKLDPLKENIQKFSKYFDGYILFFELFLLYVYLLTILWSLGVTFNMTAAIMPALGVLLFGMGILVEKAERNWFIGIRTPWTLSSETVWRKTHQLGGKLFKAIGIISVLGFLLPDFAVFFILASVLIVSFYLVVYSYLEYKKEK
jgi:uncharacterized membrane protein